MTHFERNKREKAESRTPIRALSWLNNPIFVEIMAGLSTYLSLSYIFIVNPAIIGSTGFSPEAVLFATAIVSGCATLAMGLWADLPFAVAPGLEMNGYFAYAVVGAGALVLRDAFSAVFWSGVMIVIFTRLPILKKIVSAIPDNLKVNISFSVGVFVLMTGLKLASIIPFNRAGVPHFVGWTPGLLASPQAILLYVGLALSILFSLPRLLGIADRDFPVGLSLAIIVCAIIAKFLGITAPHTSGFSHKMFSGWTSFHLLPGRLSFQFITVTFVLFMINFIGGIGKFIGLTTNIPQLNTNGKVRNIDRASYVDGFGTMLGSAFGTSSLITYVESSVGIAAGGRRGITAISCGSLMLVSLFLAPFVGLVPVEATAGVLVYAGMTLFPIRLARSAKSDFGTLDWVAAVVMAGLSIVYFGLDKAMMAGFLIYSFREVYETKGRSRNWYLFGTTLLLVVTVVLGRFRGR